MRRSKLGREFATAWQTVVAEDYANGRINSEHSLQAVLFAALKESGNSKRHIFIEPCVRLSNSGKLIRPDMMICNGKEVIAVVELKFTPRGKALTKKDMNSISAIASDSNIAIKTERYRGIELPPREFTISETTLFVWAGIHSGGGAQSTVWNNLGFKNHYFLELHALTKKNEDPRLICNTNAFRCLEGFESIQK